MKTDSVFQKCINAKCGQTYDVRQVLVACPKCGDLLDVAYDWNRQNVPAKLSDFEARWSSRRNPLD
ncbi:MAG: threonine synthase, partial [Planctomycetaceae bacterium]